MGAIPDIARGAVSLLKGMRVTLRTFFSKPVTVEYPREEAPISPRQRNAIRLIEKDDLNSHNCIACLQCEKICPSNCISITGSRPDGLAMKRPDTFDVNYALCSVCGLCLDVCPTDTLGYSKTYDQTGTTREFMHDLLEEWKDDEEQAVEKLREEAARKKAEREAKKKRDQEAKAAAEKRAAAEADREQPS